MSPKRRYESLKETWVPEENLSPKRRHESLIKMWIPEEDVSHWIKVVWMKKMWVCQGVRTLFGFFVLKNCFSLYLQTNNIFQSDRTLSDHPIIQSVGLNLMIQSSIHLEIILDSQIGALSMIWSIHLERILDSQIELNLITQSSNHPFIWKGF